MDIGSTNNEVKIIDCESPEPHLDMTVSSEFKLNSSKLMRGKGDSYDNSPLQSKRNMKKIMDGSANIKLIKTRED